MHGQVRSVRTKAAVILAVRVLWVRTGLWPVRICAAACNGRCFFTQTNPFVELTIENPYLLAHTEHGEACLKINLNDIADMVYVTTEAA